MSISQPFSLKFFVIIIKYKADIHLYSISLYIKDELSRQEVNLCVNFEIKSHDWEPDSELPVVSSTQLEGYLVSGKWAGMGKVYNRLKSMAS